MNAILQARSQLVADGTDPQVLNLRPRQQAPATLTGGRLQAVFSALPGAVLVLDGRGRVVEANPAAYELFQRPLIGETWRHVLQRDFSTRLDRGDLLAADGRRFSVATHPLGSEPGQIILLTDVSESRELQSRLAHQERLAEMGQMAASLAHQVRTPLSTALLYVSQLDNPRLESEQRSRFVKRMRERLEHLEQMVRDLLMFARSGGFSCEAVAVTELFEAIADEVRPRLLAGGGELVIEQEPGCQFWGNAEALRAALLNLADNALQARPLGLQLTLSARCGGDGELHLSVRDNGPGIAAEQRERVFQPFFTTRSDGTGLGLPVVRNLIEAHGGSIAMESLTTAESAAPGTCFHIRLPRIDRQTVESTVTGAESAARTVQ